MARGRFEYQPRANLIEASCRTAPVSAASDPYHLCYGPVHWIFATGTSLAALIYAILPAGPGKLLNELHVAESR
jgi:hypothetical protein